MNPNETLYFANPGNDGKFNRDYRFHWADFNNEPINDWQQIASTLLSIPMAHQLIGFYTVADDTDGVLKVMRSYQYYAANAISDKVAKTDWSNKNPNTERLGAYEAGQTPVFPRVLKARRQGYDGQGTHIVKHFADWERRAPELRAGDWLIEDFIPFERELALVAVRSAAGEIAFYPLAETCQVNQVCRWVLAPAPNTEALESQIQNYGRRILEALDYVGVLGMELFLTAAGDVYINELAPRVHNSGHFSQDACQTSQFALHLQAVAGLSLGSPELLGAQALMVNLLGYESAEKDYGAQRLVLANLPQARVHWYGKNSARPGRKLGHVNFLLPEPSTPAQIQVLVNRVEDIWRSS